MGVDLNIMAMRSALNARACFPLRSSRRFCIRLASTRTETDSFGPLEVPSEARYGAQTARSLINFPIGGQARECQSLSSMLSECSKRVQQSTMQDTEKSSLSSLMPSALPQTKFNQASWTSTSRWLYFRLAVARRQT